MTDEVLGFACFLEELLREMRLQTVIEITLHLTSYCERDVQLVDGPASVKLEIRIILKPIA